jgi:hypothetical protein
MRMKLGLLAIAATVSVLGLTVIGSPAAAAQRRPPRHAGTPTTSAPTPRSTPTTSAPKSTPTTSAPTPTPTTKPGATATPSPGLRLGIAYGDTLVWDSSQQLAATLDDAVQLGVRWVRTDLDWMDIQPDSASVYTWSRFDTLVDAASQRGLTVLPAIAYTPAWARPAGCGTEMCAPADPQKFATFARTAAARYASRGIHIWEVWNEENLAAYWRPAASAAAYTTLLKATAGALRDADPSAQVILGGLAAGHTESGNISQTDFLEAVAAAGGTQVVNAVGYHPYSYPFLASSQTAWGTPWERMNRYSQSLRTVLAAHGQSTMPIWITEYGAPTGGPGTAAGQQSTASDITHVTPAWQAQLAQDAVRTAATDPYVQALMWYSYKDLGSSTSTSENFFGLRAADGTAKPAYYALRQAIAALAPSSRSGNLTATAN